MDDAAGRGGDVALVWRGGGSTGRKCGTQHARAPTPQAYRPALLRPPVLNAPPRALLASAVPSLPPYCFSSPDI